MFVRLVLIAIISLIPLTARAGQPYDKIPSRARCSVCGMFVAKYPIWVAEIKTAGKTRYFDGAKDMLAFHFNPTAFNGGEADKDGEVWVKDYYSLKWIDGRKAFYVTGSDIMGPMGHEFIPFDGRVAAETFRDDHKGKMVLAFTDITPEMVEAMRHGMKMKMKMR